VNGGGFCCDDAPANAPMRALSANDNPELFQYYYHSDHLGSTSLITNPDGEVVQHVEYVPFGEVFIEERNNTWNTPYLFNAKELDEETGLYYYGARYFDPRVSVWLGVDPLWEKYPGVSAFAYCANNPVMFIDPDGREKLIFFDSKKENDRIISQGAEKYKDDGAIHIFAHGSSKGFTANVEGKSVRVTNAKQLDKFLSVHSKTWQNRKEGEDVTIVLHSCRTGEGNNSFAQNISKDMDGVTVIAPDQRVYIPASGELGTYKTKNVDSNNEYLRDENNQIKSKERSNELGNWRIFNAGQETELYKGDWKPKENPTWWDNLWYKN
jgi:RHS repeat-associated protein